MKHGTLLVVDDNRNILSTVKMVMEHTFEHIVCMASPSGLLTRIREDKPDVVLLDMNFHSGINNGNEGLYWLREIKRTQPQTAVVLFTAYADIELAVTGLKDGAADFIVKPFDNQKTYPDAYRCLQEDAKEGCVASYSVRHDLGYIGRHEQVARHGGEGCRHRCQHPYHG